MFNFFIIGGALFTKKKRNCKISVPPISYPINIKTAAIIINPNGPIYEYAINPPAQIINALVILISFNFTSSSFLEYIWDSISSDPSLQ